MDLSKGYRLRVKTGCGTCRIRKVKCDEKKPDCLRCINTGRKCDGYTPPSTSRGASPIPPQTQHKVQGPNSTVSEVADVSRARDPTGGEGGLITVQPSITQFDNASQQEAFEFFLSCTRPMSSFYYGNDFWSQYVLKLSPYVPAIRYALCSLSELHRTFQIQHDPNDQADSSEHRRNSITQYGLAIKHTQTILAEVSRGRKDRLVEGLILCVLFVCYENLIGHYKFAQMHLQNGLKILAKELRLNTEGIHSSTNGVHIPREVVGVFHRLDLQAMSFADATAPYPYGQYSEGINTGPKLPVSDSLYDFTESLTNCFRWIFTIANTSEPEPVSKRELEMATIFLRLWDLHFKRIISSYDEQTKASVQGNLQILELYHSLMVILVAVGIYGDEMLHDHHEDTYRKIVQTGETILKYRQKSKDCYIFTFEMGIILPLFYTALKCRNPGIRRNAVGLLFSAHHQEGSWESVAAGQIAEFVVKIEERWLDPKIGASSIPPNARVHMIDAHVNIEKKYIEFGCLMKDSSDNWHRQSETEFVRDEYCNKHFQNSEKMPFQPQVLPHLPVDNPICGVGRLAPDDLETCWKQRKVIPSTTKITGIDCWTVIGSMVFYEGEHGFPTARY